MSAYAMILRVLVAFVGGVLVSYPAHSQELRSMDFVTLRERQSVLMTNQQAVRLEQDVVIGKEYRISTNGIVRAGDTEITRLTEGRRITLDGFWFEGSGLLVRLASHYMMKDRQIYSVKDGRFTPLQQTVTFPTGSQLRTDGTVVTADLRTFRVQDGQVISPEGNPLPAQDHVYVYEGKLVLQKDGSIIPLPANSAIGMTDGSQVAANGTILLPGGQRRVLTEGQRIVFPGPAMPALR